MEKKEKICGVEIEKIRKSFFTGKLGKLLIDIQATGEYTEADFNQLSDYLGTLKKRDEQITSNFANFLPKIESNEADSVLDELNKESLSEAEIAELEREKSNRDAAVQFASRMLKSLFVKFYSKTEQNPSEEELLDMSFEILGLEFYIMRDALYKERLFRKKIVEFERQGKQRKMAEEMAKTCVEYRDYYLSEGLLELCREFIMLAKKRYRDKM
jgi:hypothetical protein